MWLISLIGGLDYNTISRQIAFMGDPSGNEQCFDITLQADTLLEPTEAFAIVLASNDSAIFITQSSAEVFIEDSTSELQYHACVVSQCTWTFSS